jgi:CRISPR/Cas system-associated exonuclease Cas4 (RecB family)
MQEVPVSPELANRHLEHSRLVQAVVREWTQPGVSVETESFVAGRVPPNASLLVGSIDILVQGTSSSTTLIECKTGSHHLSDRLQVLIYMYLWQESHQTPPVRGLIAYPGSRLEIASLPGDFEGELVKSMAILADSQPPEKAPGIDCRFCPITRVDCPERFEESDL